MNSGSYQRIVRTLDRKPNEARLALHLLADLALAISFFPLATGKFYPLSQILLPVLMFRSFALMHECVHGSASRHRWLNDLVGTVAGALCLLPFEPWKKIHLAHHRWAGNIDRDPSMGLVKNSVSFGPWKWRILNLCWKTWIPGLAVSQHIVFWAKSWQFIAAEKGTGGRVRNALSIAIPVLVYTRVNWISCLPGILLYLMMVEVINFPHHLRMPMLRNDDSFPLFEQYKTSRSCVYPSWFARHVLNYFNLHTEHHLFPSLPWYRLDEARKKIKAEIGDGYSEIKNNQWILMNRKIPIQSVLAPSLKDEARRVA